MTIQVDAIIDKGLKFLILICLPVVCYSLLGLYGFIALAIILSSLFVLSYRRWNSIKQKGLIASFSERFKQLLLERSILDIFRDVVYFPYITKILAAMFTIATTKPHPQLINQILKELPKQVSEISTRKGLLSLTPEIVESLVLPQNGREVLPAFYGQSQERWDRLQEYQRVKQPAHEQTVEKRVVHFLDSKLGWPSILIMFGIALAGSHQMKHQKLKKMILQNATFVCILFTLIAFIIKVRRYHHKQRKNIKRIEFDGNINQINS